MESARNRLNFVFIKACLNNPYSGAFRSARNGLAVSSLFSSSRRQSEPKHLFALSIGCDRLAHLLFFFKTQYKMDGLEKSKQGLGDPSKFYWVSFFSNPYFYLRLSVSITTHPLKAISGVFVLKTESTLRMHPCHEAVS